MHTTGKSISIHTTGKSRSMHTTGKSISMQRRIMIEVHIRVVG